MNIGEGVWNANGFASDTWTGVGGGGSIGPVPVSVSYFDNVNYQLMNSKQGSSPTGKQ